MIYLFTGAIGTGKTTYVTDQLMKADKKNQEYIKSGDLDKVRKIYSNIEGLKVPHEPLPDDWRITPKNSIIAIDECHKIEIYQPSRKVLHDDPRIVALNESRHTGHDIYFITQQPKFLHQHIRGLVNEHYHFHNPMGLNAATVFLWRNGNTTSPDSEGAKSKAERSFIYTFSKDVQSNFSSVEEDAQHTKKVNVPKKIIAVLTLLVAMISFISYKVFFDDKTTGNLTGQTFIKSAKGAADNPDQAAQNLASNIAPSIGQDKISLECRKAVNVEKPECVKFFDDLTKNKGSVGTENIVSYNPSNPYDLDQIQEQVTYQVSAKPVFSGCTKINGKYTAYTQQGTLIDNVSSNDCSRLIEHADRPFNYFAQDKTQQDNYQRDEQRYQSQRETNLSAEDIAKFQQAKQEGLI